MLIAPELHLRQPQPSSIFHRCPDIHTQLARLQRVHEGTLELMRGRDAALGACWEKATKAAEAHAGRRAALIDMRAAIQAAAVGDTVTPLSCGSGPILY